MGWSTGRFRRSFQCLLSRIEFVLVKLPSGVPLPAIGVASRLYRLECPLSRVAFTQPVPVGGTEPHRVGSRRLGGSPKSPQLVGSAYETGEPRSNTPTCRRCRR